MLGGRRCSESSGARLVRSTLAWRGVDAGFCLLRGGGVRSLFRGALLGYLSDMPPRGEVPLERRWHGRQVTGGRLARGVGGCIWRIPVGVSLECNTLSRWGLWLFV